MESHIGFLTGLFGILNFHKIFLMFLADFWRFFRRFLVHFWSIFGRFLCFDKDSSFCQTYFLQDGFHFLHTVPQYDNKCVNFVQGLDIS